MIRWFPSLGTDSGSCHWWWKKQPDNWMAHLYDSYRWFFSCPQLFLYTGNIDSLWFLLSHFSHILDLGSLGSNSRSSPLNGWFLMLPRNLSADNILRCRRTAGSGTLALFHLIWVLYALHKVPWRHRALAIWILESIILGYSSLKWMTYLESWPGFPRPS